MTGRGDPTRRTRAFAALGSMLAVVALASGLGPAHAAPPLRDDAPLTVDVEVIRSDSRSVALRVTCSRLAGIDVRAQLVQRDQVILGGQKTRKCNGTEQTTVVMTPVTSFDGGRVEPIRRLLAGRADIGVSVIVDPPGSSPAEVVSDERFPVVSPARRAVSWWRCTWPHLAVPSTSSSRRGRPIKPAGDGFADRVTPVCP